MAAQTDDQDLVFGRQAGVAGLYTRRRQVARTLGVVPGKLSRRAHVHQPRPFARAVPCLTDVDGGGSGRGRT